MIKAFASYPSLLLAVCGMCLASWAPPSSAETLPWQRSAQDGRADYRGDERYGQEPRQYRANTYRQAQGAPDPYRAKPPVDRYDYGQRDYNRAPRPATNNSARPQAYPQNRAPAYRPPPRQVRPYQAPSQQRYGANAHQRPAYRDYRYRDPRYGRPEPRLRIPEGHRGTYSENEVIDAGHRFFGSLSSGLAKAIQWAFKNSGRPNGYILGEDAGGAFVAGLRYGEGKLFTKNFGVRRIYWQGPSIGYDFGGDGNRIMTLVYNLRSPADIYRRFGGAQGSAYLVGGASVQLLKSHDVTLAPIRTGVGLRLGANIGYLKFTRRPTWNPF